MGRKLFGHKLNYWVRWISFEIILLNCSFFLNWKLFEKLNAAHHSQTCIIISSQIWIFPVPGGLSQMFRRCHWRWWHFHPHVLPLWTNNPHSLIMANYLVLMVMAGGGLKDWRARVSPSLSLGSDGEVGQGWLSLCSDILTLNLGDSLSNLNQFLRVSSALIDHDGVLGIAVWGGGSTRTLIRRCPLNFPINLEKVLIGLGADIL